MSSIEQIVLNRCDKDKIRSKCVPMLKNGYCKTENIQFHCQIFSYFTRRKNLLLLNIVHFVTLQNKDNQSLMNTIILSLRCYLEWLFAVSQHILYLQVLLLLLPQVHVSVDLPRDGGVRRAIAQHVTLPLEGRNIHGKCWLVVGLSIFIHIYFYELKNTIY